MILEVAILDIGHGTCADFEAAYREAAPLIAGSPGCISHEMRRCLEAPSRYLLLVQWETLEAHTVGFRQSPAFQKWRSLLHHFYDPAPVIQHYAAPMR